MINLSLDELRTLSEPKPKINTDKKKLGQIRKDFNELMHKFFKKKRKAIKKLFMILKTIDIFPHLK